MFVWNRPKVNKKEAGDGPFLHCFVILAIKNDLNLLRLETISRSELVNSFGKKSFFFFSSNCIVRLWRFNREEAFTKIWYSCLYLSLSLSNTNSLFCTKHSKEITLFIGSLFRPPVSLNSIKHMYLQKHVPTCMYLRTCTNLHVLTYMYQPACTYKNMFIPTCTYKNMCLLACTDLHVPTYMCLPTCAYKYMYQPSFTYKTCAYLHVLTKTCTNILSLLQSISYTNPDFFFTRPPTTQTLCLSGESLQRHAHNPIMKHLKSQCLEVK